MTANTAPPPGVNTEVSRPRVGFGHILLTVPHLALLGVLGTIAATVCFSLLTAGLASLFAFGVGLAVIAFLMQYLKRGSFLPFVIYRLVLGVVLIILLSTGLLQAY